MSLKSILQSRKHSKTFRAIQKRKIAVNQLPPYERGLYYEGIVCLFLKKQGYKIIDRNFRGRKRREIDIVAKDKDTLVFVEVKARREHTVFSPLNAIDEKKRHSLASVTVDYLNKLRLAGIDTGDLKLRFDVAALFFDENGTPTRMDYHISYLEPTRETF